jgi:hypothetical protein
MKTLEITTDIKTIDVQAREWFDKINGNSYFSARVTLNYGTDESKTIHLPFQYGYGYQYHAETINILSKIGCIPENISKSISLRRYCQDNGIDLNCSKREFCTKKEVESFGLAD